MERQREKTIDGVRYTTTIMPPDVGIPLAIKLVKLVGPATAKAIEGIGEAAFGGRSEGLIGDAVRELVLAMPDEDQALRLIRDMLVFTQADGQSLTTSDGLTDHFAGRYGQLRDVLAFVIKENGFLDFFGGWLAEALDGIKTIRQVFDASLSEPQTTESSG